ncbi:MAG: DUF1294 domain-containing protein [Thaumarchaeota archaeon]|nr:DUF1294 domain-containing protein [Nitrososphaerota archaeon]
MPLIDLSAIIPLTVLRMVFAIATVAGGGAMLIDKLAARFGLDRISEEDLGKIAIAGGFLGVTLAGLLLRHKVSKPAFWVSVVLGWAIWVTFFAIYFDPSILAHLDARVVAL